MERVVAKLESISLWENDGSYYPLYHKARAYHGLIFMLEGEGYHILHGKRFPFAPGTVSYLMENQEYHVFLTKAPMRCYVINFHLTPSSYYSDSFFLSEVPAGIPQKFAELCAVWAKKEVFYDLNCMSGVYRLMAELLQLHRHSALPSQRQEQIADSVAYLHAHFSDPFLRVEQLASMSGLSTRRYATVFQAVYGQTPKRYLLAFRIEKAKDLLFASEIPIEEVASACGFGDPFYFSRAFKGMTGMPPSEYRRRFRGV